MTFEYVSRFYFLFTKVILSLESKANGNVLFEIVYVTDQKSANSHFQFQNFSCSFTS